MAQCSVDTVGAIIDRPARKFYEFALGFGEFATFCGGGRRIGAPTPNIAPPSKSVILSEQSEPKDLRTEYLRKGIGSA